MIGFAGLSHLGIVSSAAAAATGTEVIGYDPDATLCKGLSEGRLPIVEPGLEELLQNHGARLRYTSAPDALSQCDVIYISVDVPTDAENRSDSGPVEALLRQAASVASPETTLVVLSQVRPGFSRGRRSEIESRGKNLGLFYQVETLVFGRAVERAMKPERFMVGCAEPAAPLPTAYATFLRAFGCPVLPMQYESAELAKIAINHFLAGSVAMTNTLAELCEAIGADWSEIAPALRLDARIGPHAYLTPGLGIAGGNIERDLAAVISLASAHGTDAGLVEAILANSRRRRDWALAQVQRALADASNARPQVGVWGLAYKPDTASTKNSPALALIDALHDTRVRAYDPRAVVNGSRPHLTVDSSALDACLEADVLVVMTPWKEFEAVDLSKVKHAMRGRLVVDPFAVLDGQRCAAEGLLHRRLGRRPDA